MYNTVSPIHVEGMPVYTGGVQGFIAPPKFPNLQKKVPQIAVCEQRKSEKLGILCIFGQRNGSKFREGPLLSDLYPLR